MAESPIRINDKTKKLLVELKYATQDPFVEIVEKALYKYAVELLITTTDVKNRKIISELLKNKQIQNTEEIKLTEDDQKEIDRIINLSLEEVTKELNELGITEQQIKDSIIRVKKLVIDKIKEEKCVAKVYKIFTLFNLLWKCPECEYENNTEIDRSREDMHEDVYGECEGCHKKFLLQTNHLIF